MATLSFRHVYKDFPGGVQAVKDLLGDGSDA